MSDFQVNVKAKIDWSGIETSINKPITFTNVQIDKSALANIGSTPIKLSNIDASAVTKAIEQAASSANIKLNVGTATSKKSNKIPGASDYVNNLQKELNKFQKQYDKIFGKFEDYSGSAKTGDLFKGMGEGLKDAKSQIDALQAQIKANPQATGGLDAYVKNVRSSLNASKDQLKSAQQDLKNYFKSMTDFDTGEIDKKIATVKNSFKEMGGSANTELDEAIGETVAKLDQLKTGFQEAFKAGDAEQMVSYYDDLNTSLKTAANTIKTIQKDQGGKWVNTDSVKDMIRQVNSLDNVSGERYSAAMKDLISASASGGMTANAAAEMKAEIAGMAQSSNGVESTWKRVANTIKNTATSFTAMYGTYQLFHKGTEIAREMFNNVKGIDSAMVELKKVTNQTDGDYQQFLGTASSKAKSLGTTMKDYISSTADFARLGNSWQDSQTLAEVASKYLTVGDNLTGIDQASSHIISTMNAFGIQGKDAIEIVDKFNEVSNRMPISSGGIGEMLARSASSMAAARNDLDQSIALGVAANSVVQDPETIGTAFKTNVCLYV